MSEETSKGVDNGIHFEITSWGIKIVTGNMFLDDSNYLDYIKNVLNIMRSCDTSLILMDSRNAIRNVSTFKLFDALVKNDYSTSIGRRIAVINTEETDESGSKFIADICANRGIEIQYFPEESGAVEWLAKCQGEILGANAEKNSAL